MEANARVLLKTSEQDMCVGGGIAGYIFSGCVADKE